MAIGRAERQRSHIPHEDLRRVGVEPQEAERAAPTMAAPKIVTSEAPGTFRMSRVVGEHRVPER